MEKLLKFSAVLALALSIISALLLVSAGNNPDNNFAPLFVLTGALWLVWMLALSFTVAGMYEKIRERKDS